MSTLEAVTSEDWQAEVLNSREPVVVDFWHERCEWCRRLEPELEEVAKEFLGKARFVKLNILSSPRNTLLAHKYHVRSTPTLILFCHGRPAEQLVGYRQKDTLKNAFRELFDRSDECLTKSTPFEI
jgi:thioredoxin 1